MDVLSEIERDIRAFADPGSGIMVDSNSAIWEKDGRAYTATFSSGGSNRFPDVGLEERKMSYQSFLASPWMADLASLAEFISKRDSKSGVYLETTARIESEDGVLLPNRPAADAIIERATGGLPFLSTRVLLVRGEAGSGKTAALKEVTRRLARKYRDGRSHCLLFYIDAQGRALSRLEDAMAKDLQDLRSKFTYAAIGPLTRHNLIVPIIDGFDELLGSGGYDEAFSSLAAFLATLDGQGCVVASARSAFFDYRNFYENAKRYAGGSTLNYTVDTLDILPWSESQVREYFSSSELPPVHEPSDLQATLDSLLSSSNQQNRELLSKPFYAAHVRRLLSSGHHMTRDEDLLDQLVEAFIEREHKKLLNKDGHPILTEHGHLSFLTNLAEEMWWQEKRTLDVSTVQTVAELVTESMGLPLAAAKSIVERVSAYAFLTSEGVSQSGLRFEHEVFYGYFLALRLIDIIQRDQSELRRFLSRSVIDSTIIDQSVKRLGGDVDVCSGAVDSLIGSIRPSLGDFLARENAGSIIAALMRTAGTLREGITLRYCLFKQVSMCGVELRYTRFTNCELDGVDMRSTSLKHVAFEKTTIRGVRVRLGDTRLEGIGRDFLESIYDAHVEGNLPDTPMGHLYSPEDLSLAFSRMGATIGENEPTLYHYSERSQKMIETLDRFIRRMERNFYISEEDLQSLPYAQKAEWQDVWALLRKHALLEDQIGPKSGRRMPLIRLSVPPVVLRNGESRRDPSLPQNVVDFWREMLEMT